MLIISFNLYLSPNIYKNIKLNEYELRNTINFENNNFKFFELNEIQF